MKKEKKKSKSLILYYLDVFTSFFYRKLSTGFFGMLTDGCLEENRMLSRSFIATHLNSSSHVGLFLRKIRFLIAEQFEESRILFLWRRLVLFLVGSKLRLYGSFLMTFGIYTGLVYFIKPFIETSAEADPMYLVWGIALALVAFPMLLTSKTLSQALNMSTFGHFLVSDVFGIPDEKLSVPNSKHGDSYSVAIFVGLVFGSVSYFFSPVYVLALIGIFVAIALIMSSPEIGVVSVLALLPIFSAGKGESALILMVLLYSFSFLIKLLRGKRVIRFGFSDLLILIFCFLLVLSGALNVWNTAPSLTFRTVFIIIGCIIAGNLMSTKQWQRRCVMALVFSGFFTSLITIWKGCTSSVNDLFGLSIDTQTLEGSVLFGNRDYLAMFLLICLVMTVTLIYTGGGIKHRFNVNVMSASMIIALLLTASMASIIACFTALTVFFMIMSRRTIKVGAFAVVAVPSVALILGGEILSGVLSFLNFTPAFTNSMEKIFMGSFDLIRASYFLGLGEGGFEAIYPVYAYAGFENVSNAGAFWLTLLCDTGILGLALIFALVFLLFKNVFGFLKQNTGKDKKAFIAGALAALLGLLVQSLFCDFSSRMNLLYLFFAIICISFSSIRTGCEELDKLKNEKINTEYASSVEL